MVDPDSTLTQAFNFNVCRQPWSTLRPLPRYSHPDLYIAHLAPFLLCIKSRRFPSFISVSTLILIHLTNTQLRKQLSSTTITTTTHTSRHATHQVERVFLQPNQQRQPCSLVSLWAASEPQMKVQRHRYQYRCTNLSHMKCRTTTYPLILL